VIAGLFPAVSKITVVVAFIDVPLALLIGSVLRQRG
jgi:hypothetical protein